MRLRDLVLNTSRQSNPNTTASPNSFKPILVSNLKKLGKIYVINLERRKDRKRNMIHLLGRLGLEFNFFTAKDGLNYKNHFTKINKENNNKWGRINSPGALGIVHTYREICKSILKNKIIDENNDRITILEDDVVPICNFWDSFSKLPFEIIFNYDVIYLGANQKSYSNNQLNEINNDNLYYLVSRNKEFYTSGAFAISLNRKAIELLSDKIHSIDSNLMTVDMSIYELISSGKLSGIVLNPNLFIADVSESDNMGPRDLISFAKQRKWNLGLYNFKNNNLSLVSIIVPVFNTENYLLDCYHSLAAQTHTNIEIIFIDDCSTDNSVEIIENIMKTDPRVRLITNEINFGSGPSRNKGLLEARGDFVRFVDSDDFLPPNSIELLFNFLNKNLDVDAVKGGFEKFEKGVCVEKNIWDTSFIIEPSRLSSSKVGLFTYGHWSYLFRKAKLLENSNLYPSMSNAQDNVFLQNNVFKFSKIAYINKNVYNYRVRPGSAITGKRNTIWFKNVFFEKFNLYRKCIVNGLESKAAKILYNAFTGYFNKKIFPSLTQLDKNELFEVVEFLKAESISLSLDSTFEKYSLWDVQFESVNKLIKYLIDEEEDKIIKLLVKKYSEFEIIKISERWGKEYIRINKSNPEGRLNFGLQRGFGVHRSGWNYAIISLASINNPDASVLFDGYLEDTFKWSRKDNLENDKIPYKKPWVGFIHSTTFVPKLHREIGISSIEDLFHYKEFKESLPFCKGIFVLASYVKDYIKSELLQDYPDIPVSSLLHPTGQPQVYFSFDKFMNNQEKKLIQIGYSRRRFQSIHNIESDVYKKVRLVTNTPNYLKYEKVRMEEKKMDNNEYSDNKVIQLTSVSDSYYDYLFSKNIIFLDLYDAGANNTVVECIVRETPLVINRIPPVEEYLGKDYPLFYNDLSEVKKLINDFDRIEAACVQLRQLNKSGQYSGEQFCADFKNSEVYRSL